MTTLEALGDIVNVVAAASGVHIKMHDCEAVTFITYEDDGSTILTLKESVDGADEQNLAVIDRAHKGPGIGGTWTRVTQTAAATFDLADDTTNDATVITVRADHLSDGFNCLEATVDGGICMALLHGLKVRRDPTDLRTTVV